MPKISILIPIYNVENYLRQCLDSVVNQTEHDLEIICVEDSSTDNSLKILKEYVQKDNRIKMISHSYNKGLCQTRKDGVIAATGKYIMFLDSDDYLSLNACENLYKKIEEKQVDFLQFGTTLIPETNVSEDMIKWTEDFLKPTEHLVENNIIHACYIDKIFNCSLWNKIWKTDCCKKAYNEIDDGYYVSSEDRYATFLIGFFSKKADGLLENYYFYRLGAGITGGQILDIERFKSRCQGALVVENIYKFLKGKNKFDEYESEFDAFKKSILDDCVDCWCHKLQAKDCKKGYQLLIEYWGGSSIVSTIGRCYFEKQNELLIKSMGIDELIIAIYYRYVGYSEMDPILKGYVEFYKKQKRKVYIITDDDAPEQSNSYMKCILFHIPSATVSNWSKYEDRCIAMERLLKETKISELYYLSPTSHLRSLDQLTIQSMGIKINICMDEYVLDRKNRKWYKKIPYSLFQS